jgi:hypothetical protein
MDTANIITLAEAFTIMNSIGGDYFGATFAKKDGTLTTRSLRLEVTKGVTGAGLTYDPAAHGLMTVYDNNATNRKTGKQGAFRSLNLSGLRSLRVNGEVYTVQG